MLNLVIKIFRIGLHCQIDTESKGDAEYAISINGKNSDPQYISENVLDSPSSRPSSSPTIYQRRNRHGGYAIGFISPSVNFLNPVETWRLFTKDSGNDGVDKWLLKIKNFLLFSFSLLSWSALLFSFFYVFLMIT
ncbi:hypothetical protein [Aeromonas jandaei]|uniref:hypothetical protein n=1 Tax=Aeromonas jandaei TaxID=650 RepID=UPI0039865FA8